jgi:hypothetical protein
MFLLLGLKNTLECTEQGCLEQQGWQFAIPRYPVQHLRDAVISVG